MLDDAEAREGKQHLTPKPGAEPIPVVTVMSDATVKVQQPQMPLVDLNRVMLMASAILTERTVQRAAAMERLLQSIQQRFDGFDPATQQAFAAVLGQTATQGAE
jgi:purine nucleoside permease